jgi:hypothetical protein
VDDATHEGIDPKPKKGKAATSSRSTNPRSAKTAQRKEKEMGEEGKESAEIGVKAGPRARKGIKAKKGRADSEVEAGVIEGPSVDDTAL